MGTSTKDRSTAYRKRLKASGGHTSRVVLSKVEIDVIDAYRKLINGNLTRNQMIQSIVTMWVADVQDDFNLQKQLNSTQEI
jgi:hypothetical protein